MAGTAAGFTPGRAGATLANSYRFGVGVSVPNSITQGDRVYLHAFNRIRPAVVLTVAPKRVAVRWHTKGGAERVSRSASVRWDVVGLLAHTGTMIPAACLAPAVASFFDQSPTEQAARDFLDSPAARVVAP